MSNQSDSGTQHKNNHLGLKILFGLILLFTIIWTIKAISTGFHIAIDTIVLIVAVVALIYLYIKIKEAEKHHDQKVAAEQQQRQLQAQQARQAQQAQQQPSQSNDPSSDQYDDSYDN